LHAELPPLLMQAWQITVSVFVKADEGGFGEAELPTNTVLSEAQPYH